MITQWSTWRSVRPGSPTPDRVPEATFRYLVVISILWIVALLLIFVPLAIRLYRKLA